MLTDSDVVESSDRLTATFIIPAYNRADELRRTLKLTAPLASPAVDILVVDDCSSTQDVANVAAEYAGVARYVRTDRNSGVIGARNFAYRLAKGDIIINFDDDSSYASPDTLAVTLAEFARRPRLGVMAYNINTFGRLTVDPGLETFSSYAYSGGACAYRREALEKAGSLSSLFWRQGEEIEHTLRIYEAGYEVRLHPNLIVNHFESPINRNVRLHLSLTAANHLKRTLLRYPAQRVPIGVARWIGFILRHVRSLSVSEIYRELARKDRGLRATLRHRRPVSDATYLRVNSIKKAEAAIRRGSAARG